MFRDRSQRHAEGAGFLRGLDPWEHSAAGVPWLDRPRGNPGPTVPPGCIAPALKFKIFLTLVGSKFITMSTNPMSIQYKKRNISLNEGMQEWQRDFEQQITTALKLLLESKHLYQAVTIDEHTEPKTSIAEVQSRVSPTYSHHELFTSYATERMIERWKTAIDTDPKTSSLVTMRFPDVKLYCGKCQRVEPFNLVSVEECPPPKTAQIFNPRGAVQVFTVSMLCQSCKHYPEVFLLRRSQSRLQICGRAPIEAVQVPSVIPLKVKRFHSGAMVAHQSGQTLAGLFLLRTLIEQFCRSMLSNPADHADQVMDAYMETLPDDFKSRFPSVREMYGALSVALHNANPDVELFDRCAGQITEHFDARRLFKL